MKIQTWTMWPNGGTSPRALASAAMGLSLLLGTPVARAEPGAGAAAAERLWPAGVSLPVRVVGIDPEWVAELRPALAATHQAVAAAWLQTPRPLTATLAAGVKLTVNAERLTDQMLVGAPRLAGDRPLALEVTWVEVRNREVFFLTVVDSRRGVLLASRHVAIPRSEFEEWASARRSAWLISRLGALVPTTVAAARARPPNADELHVALVSGRPLSRQDEGDSHGLLALLEERLAPKVTVVRNLGGDHLATLRDRFGVSAGLTRPNRVLNLRFDQPEADPPRRQLPMMLDLWFEAVAAVHGDHLGAPRRSTWSLADGAEQSLQVTAVGADPVTEWVEGEMGTLRRADGPQVAKVKGAWVYLDRGRAFGLRMADRLIAEVDGKVVKGHVVRYFGPEEGLKSPRGFAIEEGAILYVRKGQRWPRLGTEFRFDSRRFPAPYPAGPGG